MAEQEQINPGPLVFEINFPSRVVKQEGGYVETLRQSSEPPLSIVATQEVDGCTERKQVPLFGALRAAASR